MVLPMEIKNAVLALRTASLFEVMSSRGKSSMLSIERAGRVKWSETAVDWSMCCFVMAFSIGRRAGDVMSYASLFVGREKSVRCGSLCNFSRLILIRREPRFGFHPVTPLLFVQVVSCITLVYTIRVYNVKNSTVRTDGWYTLSIPIRPNWMLVHIIILRNFLDNFNLVDRADHQPFSVSIECIRLRHF